MPSAPMSTRSQRPEVLLLPVTLKLASVTVALRGSENDSLVLLAPQLGKGIHTSDWPSEKAVTSCIPWAEEMAATPASARASMERAAAPETTVAGVFLLV